MIKQNELPFANCRINEIRSRIRIAVTKSDVNDSQAEQAELNQPSHEKAGYPICNSETTPSNWQQSSNVTLEFASSVFQQYGNNNLILDSAILRLYKINPADKTTTAPATAASGSGNVEPMPATTPSCREPYLESQIRVTVYIVHQQKKKRKLGAYLKSPAIMGRFSQKLISYRHSKSSRLSQSARSAPATPSC